MKYVLNQPFFCSSLRKSELAQLHPEDLKSEVKKKRQYVFCMTLIDLHHGFGSPLMDYLFVF